MFRLLVFTCNSSDVGLYLINELPLVAVPTLKFPPPSRYTPSPAVAEVALPSFKKLLVPVLLVPLISNPPAVFTLNDVVLKSKSVPSNTKEEEA